MVLAGGNRYDPPDIDGAPWPETQLDEVVRCMHEEMTPREQAIEARLVELEMRLSFQEQALAELSEALADARMASARNAEVIRHLLDDLGKVRSALYSDPADEPPPPHY